MRERIVAFAASRMAGDAAEDLGQEVLLVLQEKYAHVTALPELLPLSLQIMRFKIAGMRRTAARRGQYTSVSVEDIQLPDLHGDPDDALARKEMLDRLHHAISQTGDRCRRMIRWKLEGKSFGEIQMLLGVRSINTVYTWDHRCRQHLLELMGGSWEGGR